MTEIWKDIKGYEGLYQVSNLGRVKRLTFKDSIGRIKEERLLTPTDNGKGYKLIGLCKNKFRINYYIHRLVASAFIENVNNYKEINHKDEDKSNNCVDNLEWCSRKQNCNYGTAILRMKQTLTGRKLTETHKQNISKGLLKWRLNNEIT